MAKRVSLGDGDPMLVRIAVTATEMIELETQARNRLIVLVAGITVFLVLAVNALVLYRDYRIASRGREQAETFSNEILLGMADAVLVVDAGDELVVSNRQAHRLFGPRPQSFPGRVTGVFLRAVRETESPVRADLHLASGGRDSRELSVAASLVRTSGEEPYAVLLARDETQIRRLTREVQRNEKEGGNGAAGWVGGPRDPQSTQRDRHDRPASLQ